jgi:hypothetical protein
VENTQNREIGWRGLSVIIVRGIRFMRRMKRMKRR